MVMLCGKQSPEFGGWRLLIRARILDARRYSIEERVQVTARHGINEFSHQNGTSLVPVMNIWEMGVRMTKGRVVVHVLMRLWSLATDVFMPMVFVVNVPVRIFSRFMVVFVRVMLTIERPNPT
jgi:hypothetical protein